jgi:hypothetical protein
LLLVYLFYQADLCTLNALLANKEQDRRYFLGSIRLAKNCNELDWSGFYAYHDGFQVGVSAGASNGDQAKGHYKQLGAITRNFRDAIYNDEFSPWLRD